MSLLLVGIVYCYTQPPEFEGKTLSGWFRQLCHGPPSIEDLFNGESLSDAGKRRSRDFGEACQAFTRMKPDAVPFLCLIPFSSGKDLKPRHLPMPPGTSLRRTADFSFVVKREKIPEKKASSSHCGLRHAKWPITAPRQSAALWTG